MNSARIKAYIALALSALIWGAAQPLVKPALAFISPQQFMFLRYTFALPIALITLLLIYKRHPLTLKSLGKIICIETIAILNLLILYTGLKYTTALQSALILSSRPIFITILGILFIKEKEEMHEWLGLMLSVTGISIVIITPFFNQIPSSSSQNIVLGNSLILLTNVIAMVTTYLSKKTYKIIYKPMVGVIHVIFGSFFFLILNLVMYQSLPISTLGNASVLLPVVYMALFGTMLAATLQIYGFNLIEVSEATLFQYLEPLVYIPLTIFWLREPVSVIQIFGLFIILSGVTAAAVRLPKHKNKTLFHGIPTLARLRLAQEPISAQKHLHIHYPKV